MDVTPHDLRNAELREAFRGYRPEEVEELLELAAVTRIQDDAGARLRGIPERDLEAPDGRAARRPPMRPDLHEIDLSAVPDVPGVTRAAGPKEPDATEAVFQRPSGSSEEGDGGPP